MRICSILNEPFYWQGNRYKKNHLGGRKNKPKAYERGNGILGDNDKATEGNRGNKNIRLDRVMKIFIKLWDGQTINKTAAAEQFAVSEKTIQRDIALLRDHLDEIALQVGVYYSIEYDNVKKGYWMTGTSKGLLSGAETFAICKILLAGMALPKKNVREILNKLPRYCVEEEREKVKKLIQNELHYYIGVQEKENFLEQLWEIAQAGLSGKLIEIDYCGQDGNSVTISKLRTVGILFSRNYFFLLAFPGEGKKTSLPGVGELPEAYGIHRILRWEILEEDSRIPGKEQLREGEFRKRFQDSIGKRLPGEAEFCCSDPDIQQLFADLPTAEITPREDGSYTVRMNVFGGGIDWWLWGR